MITGTLTARKTGYDPPSYRVIFDDGTGPVEVGSVSERTSHTRYGKVYWRWGVDVMPLMDHGGRPPTGEAVSRDAALTAFREAFFRWLENHADDWPENRDYKKASLVGRR